MSELTFQHRKAASQFDVRDRDGDEYLEQSDYETVFAEIPAECSAPSKTRWRVRTLLARYPGFLHRLVARADSDGDHRVIRVELLALVGASVKKASGRAMRPVADAVFATADGDGDGQVSREELARLLKVMDALMDAEAVGELFGSGGRLSREPFVEMIEDYYAGDQQAPGSRFFGSVES